MRAAAWGASFAARDCKKEESPALDGELDVLHVAARALERLRRGEKLRVGFGQFLRKSATAALGVNLPETTSSPCARGRYSP